RLKGCGTCVRREMCCPGDRPRSVILIYPDFGCTSTTVSTIVGMSFPVADRGSPRGVRPPGEPRPWRQPAPGGRYSDSDLPARTGFESLRPVCNHTIAARATTHGR